MAEQEYERLTRTRSRSAFALISVSRVSLWLGKDHLLCVETNGYSEDYKRFYFRDIQAIIIRENSARNVTSFIFGGLAVVLAVIGSTLTYPVAGRVTLLSAAGVSLLVAVINFLLGPTCSCQIRTAVQTESLPLIRIRRAQRFLERIRPLIVAAQGQLTTEEITARMQQPAAANPAPVQERISTVQAESVSIPSDDVQSGENKENLGDRADQEIGAPEQGQDALPNATEPHGRDARATTDSDAPPEAVS